MNIVNVQFEDRKTKEFVGREYAYYSEDTLAVGQMVKVPTRYGDGTAKVSKINVDPSDVKDFEASIKTIGSSSKEELAEIIEPCSIVLEVSNGC